jgi:hypothetical protein
MDKAQLEIDEYRNKCDHAKTRIGLYSWRVGCIENWVLCVKCDFPIERAEEQGDPFETDGPEQFTCFQ